MGNNWKFSLFFLLLPYFDNKINRDWEDSVIESVSGAVIKRTDSVFKFIMVFYGIINKINK